MQKKFKIVLQITKRNKLFAQHIVKFFRGFQLTLTVQNKLKIVQLITKQKKSSSGWIANLLK